MREKIKKLNVMMLATLEALYLHGTTVLAAEKLGIAQPSVSWYLKQLREMTGDVLFIRTPDGYEPTDFCRQYYLKAREALDRLELLAADRPEDFDPKAARAEFSVAIPFFKARLMLEALSVDVMQAWPGIRTNLLYLEEKEALQCLENRLLDIYIGVVSEKLPKHFMAEKVMTSAFILLCSEKSRFFESGRIRRDEFLAASHIKVAAGFHPSTADTLLKKHGLAQENQLMVPDIGSEIILLREMDVLAMVDRQDAGIIMEGSNFKTLETTDFDLPQLDLYAVWHARKRGAQDHVWFREYLKKRCREYADGRRPDPARFTA
ncbi:MAG: LysR family transcriptional regulator [Alphaproteobacteria bacterium]|nr:LysR family transcriptional regulator [Alphaproteobacteria bacterium]